jgi:hypothetical protein
MAIETFGPLTGVGELDFSAASGCYAVFISCTVGSLSEQLEPATSPRWTRLGWWNLLEHQSSFLPAGFAVGNYSLGIHWIQQLRTQLINVNDYPFEGGGCDGFQYMLYPGVTAYFAFLY